MSLHHFGFSSPSYLLSLLVIPALLVAIVLLRRRRSRYTVTFTNLGVLAGASTARHTRWQRWVPLALLLLALAFEGTALARPHIKSVVNHRSTTVVLLVDVSGSMQAADIYPTRLGAVVAAMHNFLRVVPKKDKVGLITFSDKVAVVDAPTTDHTAVASGLNVLSPQGGTALGTGVQTAVRTVVSTLAAEGVYQTPGRYLPGAIILESDGAQNRGTVALVDAAELAKTTGVRIYGIALGTRHGYIVQGRGLLKTRIGVPPDPGAVALLARESGGQSFNVTNAERLNTIYRNLGSTVGRDYQQTEITWWFELAAAILVVAGVGLARLRGTPIP